MSLAILLFVVLGVVLSCLAGLGIGAPRLQLGWFGLAAAVVALALVSLPG